MMEILRAGYRQSFNIAPPPLTESNLPDQTGRVSIITGGYAGVGQELSRIIYSRNGTVYVAGRSAEKAAKSIEDTKAKFPDSKGKIEFLKVDLADLRTIKGAVKEFEGKEERLDVLVNNAGVMIPPVGSKSEQGLELQMGTNVVGPWLFTELLVPLLERTARKEAAGKTRVLWAGSMAVDAGSPTDGVMFDESGAPKVFGSPGKDYGQSKAGNVILSREFANRHKGSGIVSVAFNPGNLKSELQRHTPALVNRFFGLVFLFPAVYGAYTELWAGWSEDVKVEGSGWTYAVPWGRDGSEERRSDIKKALEEGSLPKRLWEWCAAVTKEFR